MIRVLVAEDSSTARLLLIAILSADPEIEVIGEAHNGRDAIRLTQRLKPDIITMDIDMPFVDGLTATEEIMTRFPTPIVIVSAAVKANDIDMSLRAMRAGALTSITKPENPNSPEFTDYSVQLVAMVKAMAQTKVVRRRPRRSITPPLGVPVAQSAHTPQSVHAVQSTHTTLPRDVDLVAIVASTGGPAAVQSLISKLPATFPVPIVVVQHIAPGFTAAMIDWLATTSALSIKLAQRGEILQPGSVYIAPEKQHLEIKSHGRVSLSRSAPLDGFRPSGTWLFRSVASSYGSRAIGIILTGMGRDGVDGLVQLHRAGSYTIAQDESTSVVYGMPHEAVHAGATNSVLPLDQIAGVLLNLVPR